MPDTQTPDAIRSYGTQPVVFMDAEKVIQEQLRAWGLPGNNSPAPGWSNPSPTGMRPEPVIKKTVASQRILVTFSKDGEMTITLTSDLASSTLDKAITADQFMDDEMLSSAPTVNVQPGMRVELTGTPSAAILRGRTGTVVREDIYDDYVIVALDTPALYRLANGEVKDLPEIAVMVDNLRVLSA